MQTSDLEALPHTVGAWQDRYRLLLPNDPDKARNIADAIATYVGALRSSELELAPVTMDPDVKNRWLESLRYGTYKQAESRLCVPVDTTELGYCCMGVLADVIDSDAWTAILDERQIVIRWNENVGKLNPRHLLNVGLDGHAQDMLVSVNDRGGSFDLIARIIEDLL